jgi:hypothetical protein
MFVSCERQARVHCHAATLGHLFVLVGSPGVHDAPSDVNHPDKQFMSAGCLSWERNLMHLFCKAGCAKEPHQRLGPASEKETASLVRHGQVKFVMGSRRSSICSCDSIRFP